MNLQYAPVIEVPQEGARIHYDINLGRDFERIEFKQAAIEAEMARQNMPQEAIDRSEVFISAKTRQDPEGRYTNGHYRVGRIEIYMGSLIAGERERQKLGVADGKVYPHSMDDYIAFEATEAVAHEISHLADDEVMGREAVDKEYRRYARGQLARRLVPDAVVAGGGLVVMEAAAGVAVAADKHVTGIGLGLAVAILDVGFFRDRIKERRQQVEDDFKTYQNRPEEVRAQERAREYMDTLRHGGDFLIESTLKTQPATP